MAFTTGAPKFLHFPPEKRIQLCRDLALDTNPLQDQIVGDPRRFLMFRAARRVGKSFTAAKRHFAMSMIPKSLHWIVGPTYDLAHKEFRYWLEFLQRLQSRLGKRCLSHVAEQPATGDLTIKTTWGSVIIGKSAVKPESLLGDALDSVILAEAAQLSREVWERYIRATLATKEGYATFASSPDSAGLWLYEMEMAALAMPDLYGIYTMPAWECPHYSVDEIEAARRELSEDAFYEQYGGEWRFYTGRVYKIFRPDIHLVDPFPIPQSWQVGSGIDFGSRDPMTAQLAAKSPSGEVYFFGEYYQANQELSTPDHCAAILRCEEKWDVKNRVLRVADHHGLGRQLITDAARYGMPCSPCASHDRRARRDAALAAFTLREGEHPYHVREAELPPGSYPKVFIMKGRCPNLVRELQFLRWRDATVKEGATNDTDGDDHAVDAMEYLLERWRIGKTLRHRRAGNASTGRAVLDKTGYYSRLKGPIAKKPYSARRVAV